MTFIVLFFNDSIAGSTSNDHMEYSISISIYDFMTLNVMGSAVGKDIFSDVHFINPGK